MKKINVISNFRARFSRNSVQQYHVLIDDNLSWITQTPPLPAAKSFLRWAIKRNDYDSILFLIALKAYIEADQIGKVDQLVFNKLLSVCEDNSQAVTVNITGNTGMDAWRLNLKETQKLVNWITPHMQGGNFEDAMKFLSQVYSDIKTQLLSPLLTETGVLPRGTRMVEGMWIRIPHIPADLETANGILGLKNVKDFFARVRKVGVPIHEGWDRLEF